MKTMKTAASVDIEATFRFLKVLDPTAKSFTFQTLDDTPAERDELTRVLDGPLRETFVELERLNKRGAGVFVVVNATDQKGRRKENILRVRAVFADLDGAPLDPVLAFQPPPNVIVETSPGRFHAYWLARGVELAAFGDIQKRIAATFNADGSVSDLPRVMRLPGFYHQKKAPFMSKIIRVNGRPAYTGEEIAAAFPPLKVPHANPQQPTTARVKSTGDLPSLTDRIKRASAYLVKIPGAVSGEGGHDATWKAALAVVKGFSLPDDDAFELLWRDYNNRCAPPWTERELRHKITDAAKSNMPDGYLLQDSTPPHLVSKDPPKDLDPTISEEAFHGLAGDIVRLISPHTEADPVGLLVSTIAEFGTMIGRTPHLILDGSYHPLLVYPILIGRSSKSRKGSAGKRIKTMFSAIDPEWTRGEYKGTLSSGEGLCFAVRDPMYTEKNGEKICIDSGVSDKRLFLVQSEFGSVLRVMARDGNSLSGVIRDNWDGEDLAPMTKGNRVRATAPHIGIVGHVTRDELLKNLTDTEASNGFGNRFMWVYVKRSKELPFPTSPDNSEINRLIPLIRNSLNYARGVGELTLTDAAKDIWREVYHDLSKDRPGLSGSLLNRSEAYVMRLSAIYALLDRTGEIDTPHLLAALALWEYSVASVRFIFGGKTGDSVADAIHDALKQRGEMTDTEISAIFNRHQSAARLSQAKTTLRKAGLIVSETKETDGRKVTFWTLTQREIREFAKKAPHL